MTADCLNKATIKYCKSLITFYKINFNNVFACCRAIWLLIFLAAIGLFILMLNNNIVKLQSHPTSVDITDQYMTSLAFPAVTVCNENSYR